MERLFTGSQELKSTSVFFQWNPLATITKKLTVSKQAPVTPTSNLKIDLGRQSSNLEATKSTMWKPVPTSVKPSSSWVKRKGKLNSKDFRRRLQRLWKGRLVRGILQATRESALRLESNMKLKKVAVTAAVCSALMGPQAVVAEEEDTGFAFDNAQVSSLEMSELSGSEMDATRGAVAYFPQGTPWPSTRPEQMDYLVWVLNGRPIPAAILTPF